MAAREIRYWLLDRNGVLVRRFRIVESVAELMPELVAPRRLDEEPGPGEGAAVVDLQSEREDQLASGK